MTTKEKEIEIETKWFENHVAKLEQHGGLQVLTFGEVGTSCYYIRFVFDNHKLYISGDLGEAVFSLTWKATLESFSELNLGYFLGKLTAYDGDKYDFNGNLAKDELVEWFEDYKEDTEFTDQDIEDINELINGADNCSSEEQWAWEYINCGDYEIISDYGLGDDGWIYMIGRETPIRLVSYLVALKMAYTQLRGE